MNASPVSAMDLSRRKHAVFEGSSVIALSAILLCWGLARPWIGHHDSNGGFYSMGATQALRHGFLTTKFAHVRNGGPQTPGHFDFFFHHPHMIIWWTAAFQSALDSREWAVRLSSIIPMSLASWMLWLIGRRFSPTRSYALALGVGAAMMPLFAYFGRHPECMNLVHPLLLFGFYAYDRWICDNFAPRRFLIFAAVLFLGCQTEWLMYLLAPSLWAVHVFRRRPKLSWLTWLCVMHLAFFGLYLLHAWWALGTDGWTQLLEGLRTRTVGENTGPGGIYLLLARMVAFKVAMWVTVPLVLLAMVGLWIRGKGHGHACSTLDDIVMALIIISAIWILALPRNIIPHEFMLYPVGLLILILAVDGLWTLASNPRLPFRTAAAVLATLYIAQAGFVLAYNHSEARQQGYILTHDFCKAVATTTRFEDAIATPLNVTDLLAAYYADRYLMSSITSMNQLHLREAQTNRRARYWVIGIQEELVEKHPYYRAAMQSGTLPGVFSAHAPEVLSLQRQYRMIRIHGFRLFDLIPPVKP
ncbi:MAG: glycosyltransferase family 39 protein [Planctomycetota bacterium]